MTHLHLLLLLLLRSSFGQTTPSPTAKPTYDAHPANLQEILDNFQCFDDKKVNYFQNDPDTEIYEGILPQMRILQGGWESQSALNFAAALFMKEKLGMNITFWPTVDPDLVWYGQFWDNWNGSQAYPRNYFAWLADDEMDFTFEFWPSHIHRFNKQTGEKELDAEIEFIIPGSVDFGGSVGPYGEESLWMPQYIVDEYPDFIIPESIRDNAMYRELLINASRGIGGNCDNETLNALWGNCTDFIPMYVNTTGNLWDDPTYDRPPVWGSGATYYMSEYAYDLLNTYPVASAANGNVSGINVTFTATSASTVETLLWDIVTQMYRRRLPFIANIYTIDINFGSIDPLTGDLQNFQKMAYPRNSDQSADDTVFVKKQCQYPISQLYKAANPRTEVTFPEAHQFYSIYQMPTSQLNLLVSKYLTRKVTDTDTTTLEKWLSATCDWMKDESSNPTWNRSSWHVEIERYNCLSGCGIELEGNFYGGSCDYHTGQCVCDYPELFTSTHCKGSCPGLVGPYANASGDYVFDWCSGHGVCDVEYKTCTCEDGYGDAGCGTKYQFYDFLPLTVAVCALSAILAIIGIACIIWLRSAAEYKTVKALSVNMTTIMTIGIIFITCSNIALAVPVNSVSCIAWQWLFGLGGILAIMSPLLKAYRVSRVFHGGKMLRAVKITDAMLMSNLIKAAVLEIILCIAYSVAHEIYGGTHIYYNHDELRSEIKCNDSTITAYLSMGSYAYFFVVLCILTYYSWGTRRALSVFKESTCAYFSSFLSLLCTLITFVFYMATEDPAFRVAVQAFAIIIVISCVLVLFYAQRIYQFYQQPQNRNVTDARGASSHVSQKSSSASSVMKPGPNANA